MIILKREMNIISSILVILLFVGILTDLPLNGQINIDSKNIIYVDADANQSWYDETHVRTIQEGIDNASLGDRVYVYNGTYIENIFINKTIELNGENKFFTVIDGGFTGSTITVQTNFTKINNCTIQHGGEGCSPDQFAGIRILGENNLITNTIIKRNSNFGLSINASNNTITNNQVYGNCGEGIFLTQTSNQNLIYNNIFVDDALDYGENIWNISKIQEANIVNGPYVSGNYWANYIGVDENDDGIGDTKTPYNSSGNIQVGGDYAPLLDQIQLNQSISNRGFPIRHAVDGDWGAAQNFTHETSFLSRVSVLVRKFGDPEFNLTIELRKESVNGNLSRKIMFLPDDISSDWQWLNVNFDDFIIPDDTDYFIIIPPAPNSTTSSFGYEWGYAFGNQYDDGSFWFTRDGGNLWRELPTTYEFSFFTYGY